MLLYKQKKSPKGNRFLISITVMGSAGPIRFVVSEGEVVNGVIDTALKSYAREGRLPELGSQLDDFLLYCPNYGSDALSPWDTIGSQGSRNFLLCKKPRSSQAMGSDQSQSPAAISRKGGGGGGGGGSGSWKSWINKSFNRKVLSH